MGMHPTLMHSCASASISTILVYVPHRDVGWLFTRFPDAIGKPGKALRHVNP